MSSPTILMTVRHAATEFNRERRYAGLMDVPLSEDGMRDTIAAARNFDDRVDVVISSPMTRAIDTARALAGEAREIVPCELCNERDYGRMQGLTSGEVEDLQPFIRYFKMGGDFHSLNPPAGETLPALRRRARAFADYALSEFAGKNVLVVSHEVFLLQLHGLVRGEKWREAMRHKLPNLTLTTLTLCEGRLAGEAARALVSTPQEDGSAFAFPSASVPSVAPQSLDTQTS